MPPHLTEEELLNKTQQLPLINCGLRSLFANITESLILFLIFEFAQSWIITFSYLTARAVVSFLFRSFGLTLTIGLARALTTNRALLLAIGFYVASLGGMVMAVNDPPHRLALTLTAAVFYGTGDWLYYNLFHAYLFPAMASSGKSGASTASVYFYTIVGDMIGGIIAAILIVYQHPAIAFLVAAAAIIGTIFFNPDLRSVDLEPKAHQPKADKFFPAIGLPGFLANMGVPSYLVSSAICVLLVEGSGLARAVILVVGASLLKILTSHTISHAVDRQDSAVLKLCGAIAVLCSGGLWAIAGQALAMTGLKLANDITDTGMGAGLDARMSHDVAAHWPLQVTTCFESARALGGVIGFGIPLAVMYLAPDFIAYTPIFGIPFIFFRLFYVRSHRSATA